MKILLIAFGLVAVSSLWAGVPAKDAIEAHAVLEKTAPAVLGFDGLPMNSVPKAIAESWTGKKLADLRKFEADLSQRSGELVFDCEHKKDRDQIRLGALYSEDRVFFMTLVFWHDGRDSIRQTLVMLEDVSIPKKKEPNQTPEPTAPSGRGSS